MARPSLCCREDAGANLRGPGSTGGPAGRQPLAGDVAPDVALEWPGVTRAAPSLLRPPVQGAQRHEQNRGTQGAGGCLPSPSRRAGSPQRPHWSTTAPCRGVYQGPARDGGEAPVSPGSLAPGAPGRSAPAPGSAPQPAPRHASGGGAGRAPRPEAPRPETPPALPPGEAATVSTAFQSPGSRNRRAGFKSGLWDFGQLALRLRASVAPPPVPEARERGSNQAQRALLQQPGGGSRGLQGAPRRRVKETSRVFLPDAKPGAPAYGGGHSGRSPGAAQAHHHDKCLLPE